MHLRRSSSTCRRRPGAAACAAAALFVVVLAVGGCGTESAGPLVEGQVGAPLIRVKLGKDVDRALVTVHGDFQLYDMATDRLVEIQGELAGALFDARQRQLHLDGRSLGTDRLVVVPRTDGEIEVAGKRYRGNLRVFAVADKVVLVNCLDLEEYLASVVGEETYTHWHLECLKAQAVAARTYALYQIKRAAQTRLFDVYDSPGRSQAYSGRGRETEKSRLAVRATRGVVLAATDGGRERLFEALYHSTCGGRTVAVWHVWPDAERIEPLGGVDCPYCRASRMHHWTFQMLPAELRRRLRENVPDLRNLGKIDDVTVEPGDLTSDGIALKVSLWTDERSVRRPLPVDTFKGSFSPDKSFPSERFTVSLVHGEVVIEGRGFGHGVGMCQFGAEEQARRGRRAEGILSFYYPGSKLVRVY